MNHKKLVFSAALFLNALTVQSQTPVFFTQLESKKDVSQIIIVDENGKQILVATPAMRVHSFSEDLAPIQTMDKKYGFINTSGQLVIPSQFEAVGHFSGGMAWAKADNGQIGYIDVTGKWAINAQFDVAKSFDKVSGMARVKKDDQWYYVNNEGKALMVDTDAFFDFSDGLAVGEKGGLRGYFDKEGKWIVEPKFQDARKFENGYGQVKLNNLWGLIDTAGNWVIEAKYEVMKQVETIE